MGTWQNKPDSLQKGTFDQVQYLSRCSPETQNFHERQAKPLLNRWKCSSIVSYFFEPINLKFLSRHSPKSFALCLHWLVQPRVGTWKAKSSALLPGEEPIETPAAVPGAIVFISVCSLDASSSLPFSFPSTLFSVNLFFWTFHLLSWFLSWEVQGKNPFTHDTYNKAG